MRVLLWLDTGHGDIPGGHRVQIERTADALERQGVEMIVSGELDPNFSRIDVVHGIGVPASGLHKARMAGKPVAVSTIYWGRDYVTGPPPWLTRRQRLERVARIRYSMLRRGPEATWYRLNEAVTMKALSFECADLLLPNSQAEADAIASELRVMTPAHVVPNAIDPEIFRLPHQQAPREGVLYAGRIEPHKNQLGLIKALAGSGLKLTIVGQAHPHHNEYVRRCLEAADDNVTFLDGRDQAGLVELYQQAAVHAMPSWFETTGLSSLEAAACGAAVVTTSRGFASEYFRDLAQYCDPGDPPSILRAVRVAIEVGPSAELRDRIRDVYTWDATATATLNGYRSLLRP